MRPPQRSPVWAAADHSTTETMTITDPTTFDLPTSDDVAAQSPTGVPPEALTGRTRGVAKFAARYNVHGRFIPFASQAVSPYDALNDVRIAILATPGTAQHVSRPKVNRFADHDYAATALPVSMFLIHGAYPVAKTSESGSFQAKFANPTFTDHDDLPSVTDQAERLAWLDRYAALGVHELSDVLDHFGYGSRSSVRRLVYQSDFSWSESRTAGRRRMARTWKVAQRWGVPHSKIAEAFGLAGAHIPQDWIGRYAADFEVPEDPTTNHRGAVDIESRQPTTSDL